MGGVRRQCGEIECVCMCAHACVSSVYVETTNACDVWSGTDPNGGNVQLFHKENSSKDVTLFTCMPHWAGLYRVHLTGEFGTLKKFSSILYCFNLITKGIAMARILCMERKIKKNKNLREVTDYEGVVRINIMFKEM